MPSLSFDRVAHSYDATRGYPSGVDRQIAEAIASTVNATPETSFMEVGIGTGRIAFPLASLGHNYTGVDISGKMVEQLIAKLLANGWQEFKQSWGSLPGEQDASAPLITQVRRFRETGKRASMRLVMSDMTALPFRDSSFDVVLAVHVFHLVDGWQQAMREVLRVLRPGGAFLHCWDELINTDAWPVGETWAKIVGELGGDLERPGVVERAEITEWLREQGLHPQEYPVARWEITQTPREAVEQVTRRLWSSTWVVPDDLFATSVERLEIWARDYFGAEMDTPLKGNRQFIVCKTEV